MNRTLTANATSKTRRTIQEVINKQNLLHKSVGETNKTLAVKLMKNINSNSAYVTLTAKRSGTSHGSRVRTKSKKSKGISEVPAWDNSQNNTIAVKPQTAGSPSRNK